MNYLKRTWAEINLDVFENNIDNLKKALHGETRILGVVKADAYGHGDIYISKKLQEMGVTDFGVSNLDEALSLRSFGITGNILIFGFTPPEAAKKLADNHITQAVFCSEYARLLSDEALKAGVTVDIHIKLDTGMGRIGFMAAESIEKTSDEVFHACSLPSLNHTGIFTHFASADESTESGKDYTKMQFNIFMSVINSLQKKGVTFKTRHCCNSAGAVTYPEMQLDMVRLGIIMYGHNPDGTVHKFFDVKPVMSLKSTVSMVKMVPENTSVSYNRTFTSKAPMKIATIPIGYADGFMRLLSNKGRVIINDEYAPIIGKVCMDQIMVDVTHIKDVHMQDEVIIFGESQTKSVTAEDIASAVGTISYEVLCVLGKRVPRIYIQNGKEVAALNYINKSI